MCDGWIKVSHKLQDHWIWNGEPFSKGQAWIDLILLANWETKKAKCRGSLVECKRGDVNLSISVLAERWSWDRKTVRRFLNMLESDGMVTVNATTRRTTITIVNYASFQDKRTTESTTEGTAEAQLTGQLEGQVTPTTKNIKNIKKDKNSTMSDKSAVDDVVNLFSTICVSYPQLKSISESRRKAIKARLNTYSMADFEKLFYEAESSDFLKGKNKNNWSANFDWLMKDANFTKVLEGNYRNKGFQRNNDVLDSWGTDDA